MPLFSSWGYVCQLPPSIGLHRWALMTFNTRAPKTRAEGTGNLLPPPIWPIQDAVVRHSRALTAWTINFPARLTVLRVAAKDRLAARKGCGSAPVRKEKDSRVAHRE